MTTRAVSPLTRSLLLAATEFSLTTRVSWYSLTRNLQHFGLYFVDEATMAPCIGNCLGSSGEPSNAGRDRRVRESLLVALSFTMSSPSCKGLMPGIASLLTLPNLLRCPLHLQLQRLYRLQTSFILRFQILVGLPDVLNFLTPTSLELSAYLPRRCYGALLYHPPSKRKLQPHQWRRRANSTLVTRRCSPTASEFVPHLPV